MVGGGQRRGTLLLFLALPVCHAGGFNFVANGTPDGDPVIEITRKDGSTCTLTFEVSGQISTTCGPLVADDNMPRAPPSPDAPPTPSPLPTPPLSPPPPSACARRRVSIHTAGTMHQAATEHGGHKSTTIDPVEAFAGKMILWASPSAGDVVYRLEYNEPVSLSGLSVDYDAGRRHAAAVQSSGLADAPHALHTPPLEPTRVP